MSTASLPGTFQISTDQVSIPTRSGTQEPTHVVHAGEDVLRIDNESQQPAAHFRAIQLNEFTKWLDQNTSTPTAASQSKRTHENTITPQIPGIQTKKMYRIDSPAAKQPNGQLRKPSFDMRDYVADELDLKRTMQALKADGRIIGDIQQADTNGQLTNDVVSFQWPIVTSKLVGSPAILNLEMNIQNLLTNNCGQVLITSTRQGDGATTVTIALARQMAEHGKRILIVDADLSNSFLTNRLGLRQQASWVHAISERVRLADTVISDPASSISLLPLAPIVTNVGWPRKIYDELERIIEPISRDFEVILYDVGPVDQLISETSAPSRFGDMALLVSNENIGNESDSGRAKAELLNAGVSNLLIVNNFSNSDQAAQAKVG